MFPAFSIGHQKTAGCEGGDLCQSELSPPDENGSELDQKTAGCGGAEIQQGGCIPAEKNGSEFEELFKEIVRLLENLLSKIISGGAAKADDGNVSGQQDPLPSDNDKVAEIPTSDNDTVTEIPRQAPDTANPVNEPNAGTGSNPPLLDAINRVRVQHGLSKLTEASNLTQAASANDAANNRTGKLDHHIDLGKYGSHGEITATASDPDEAVKMWLDSPGHRKILLDPEHKQVGVSIQGEYATADFA